MNKKDLLSLAATKEVEKECTKHRLNNNSAITPLKLKTEKISSYVDKGLEEVAYTMKYGEEYE